MPPIRRCLLATAATLLALGLTAACGTPFLGYHRGDTYTALDYFTDEPTHTQVGERLQRCAAEVGVKITHQSVPFGQLNAKILQEASSRTLPDVLMVNNPDVPQIASTHALKPLTDFGVRTSDYYRSVLSAGMYQGKLYGLAPTVNTLALFYNKKLLAAEHLAVPHTWSELTSAAAKLTTNEHYGFAFSATNTAEGSWTFLPFLWSNGGREMALDAPAARAALSFYTGLVKSGSASRSVVNWTQADVNDQFTAGKAAMMINGPWQIPALDKSSIDWGVTSIPVPRPGAHSVAPLGGEVWTVPVTTADRERNAARIVRCLNSEPNQIAAAKEGYTVPSRKSAARRFGAETPRMKDFVDIVGRARTLTAESGLAWNQVDTALYTALQTVITGKADASGALADAQRTVSR